MNICAQVTSRPSTGWPRVKAHLAYLCFRRTPPSLALQHQGSSSRERVSGGCLVLLEAPAVRAMFPGRCFIFRAVKMFVWLLYPSGLSSFPSAPDLHDQEHHSYEALEHQDRPERYDCTPVKRVLPRFRESAASDIARCLVSSLATTAVIRLVRIQSRLQRLVAVGCGSPTAI